jgi:integrase
VRRVVTEVNGDLAERPYGKSPKAKRDISIPEDLAPELMESGTGLCFTSCKRTFLRRSVFRDQHWKPAVKAAGLPELRVHDMRHSAISWWVADKIDIGRIRDRAGHSSISTTSKYVHALPGDYDPFLDSFGGAE